MIYCLFFFFQAEDGIRYRTVTEFRRVLFRSIGVTAQGFYGVEPASSTDFWIPLQNRPELTAWDEEPSLDTLYGTPKRSEERRVGKECRYRCGRHVVVRNRDVKRKME